MGVIAGVVAVAVLAGCLGSMLGIGGGVIMVPALTIGFGLPIKTAIATSMVCVIATSAVAQLSFMRSGMTNVRLGFALEMASAAGALLGGIAAVVLNARILQVCFAALLVYVAIHVNRRRAENEVQRTGVLEGAFYDRAERRSVAYGVKRLRSGFAMSVGAGGVAAMLGVGGGLLKVPIMNIVMGVPLKPTIATSNLMIGVTAATGALVFYGRGFVDPIYAVPAALGILAGAQAGAHLAARLPIAVLGGVFRVLLACFAVVMVLQAAGVRL